MCPEQARGKPVDKRADIWGFGVVLWEMLTGRRLLMGETISDTLAAVLRADLDWTRLPPGTPVASAGCFSVAWSAIQKRACATSATHGTKSTGRPTASGARSDWISWAVACYAVVAATGWDGRSLIAASQVTRTTLTRTMLTTLHSLPMALIWSIRISEYRECPADASEFE